METEKKWWILLRCNKTHMEVLKSADSGCGVRLVVLKKSEIRRIDQGYDDVDFCHVYLAGHDDEHPMWAKGTVGLISEALMSEGDYVITGEHHPSMDIGYYREEFRDYQQFERFEFPWDSEENQTPSE